MRSSTGEAPHWAAVALGDFVTLKRGYDLPKQERSTGAVPVISSSGISDYHSIGMSTGPGVVTGRYGTIGQVFYVEGPYWPLNTTLYVSDYKGNDPRFVSYLLRTLDFSAYSDKGAVPGVNRNHLHQAVVRVPRNIYEQRAIADILSVLDDKIELNRKMSATLEAMARALFKSWFVDFDPVRAKAEGRDPGLPPEIAALFPDSLEALLPRGWSESSIYEIADVTYGAAFASSSFNDKGEGLPLIRIRDLRSQRPSIYTTEKHPRGYLVQPGDLLVGMDGEFRPYMWCGTPGWMNQRVCCFRPKVGVSRAYVHFIIENLLADVERSEAATTVIHLGKSDLDLFRVLGPPRPVLQCYAQAAEEFERRILVCRQESHTLATLRDALLPKLISGKVRVKIREL